METLGDHEFSLGKSRTPAPGEDEAILLELCKIIVHIGKGQNT